jgi:VWFA-related protein
MNITSRRMLAACILLVATWCAATAQTPAPPEPPDIPSPTSTLSIRVRVVAFDAVVRNRSGELVHHLTRNDFTLTEDGKPQPIRYFDEDADLPLTIGLAVDTSGSQRRYFAEQQLASATFLTKMLTHPDDNAFISRFDNNVLLLQKMTTSLSALQAALGRLSLQYPARVGPPAGTLLFDGICGIAEGAFSKSRTRRALIILTDGEDNGSLKNRDDATTCAQRADVAVYTALYTSRDPGPQEEDDPRVRILSREHLMGRTIMERISRATGGRLFVVTPQMPIEKIYAQIEQDLRMQYRIGYTPPPSAPGTFHELAFKPVDKHLKAQTRIGYYTPK